MCACDIAVQVIYMMDAIDEYVMQHLTDYDDFKFMNVQKEGVQFDESDEWKEMYKEKEKEWKDFTDWFLILLGDKVGVVILSTASLCPFIGLSILFVSSLWCWSHEWELCCLLKGLKDLCRSLW